MIIGFDGRLANDIHKVGSGQFCYELLNGIAPLLNNDKLVIYLDSPPKSFFPLKESKNIEIKILQKKKFWTQTVLPKELNTNPPDIFYSPSLQTPFWGNCPKSCTIFDIAYYDFPSEFTWKAQLKAKLELNLAIKTNQLFITISESSRQSILERFPKIEGRLHRVYLGVSNKVTKASKEEQNKTREKYGLNDPYILYLGRIQPRKNINRLIEAYEDLCDNHPEILHHLVIVGSLGWLYEPILNKIRKSKYAHKIHYLGYLESEEEKVALISSATVLVLISLWEGFGLPIIEAMNCETPVLASNCSSIPEIVADSGILVNPYEIKEISQNLYKVLTDEVLRTQLSIKGKKRAQLFTWENTAKEIFNILHNYKQ
ncbi:MAG: glycosyltransferase family 4 protein [Candidatus Hydrogenedens sp.]